VYEIVIFEGFFAYWGPLVVPVPKGEKQRLGQLQQTEYSTKRILALPYTG